MKLKMDKRKIFLFVILGVILLLAGYSLWFSTRKIQNFNNSVFTKEQYQKLETIEYWDTEEKQSKKISDRKKLREIYAVFASAKMQQADSDETSLDGHMIVTMHFENGSMEIGLLSEEMTVYSEEFKLNSKYKITSEVYEKFQNILF